MRPMARNARDSASAGPAAASLHRMLEGSTAPASIDAFRCTSSDRVVEVCSDTAIWYRAGLSPLPIRWGLLCDLRRRFDPHARPAGPVLRRRAARRASAPSARLAVTTAAWYHKRRPSFADTLATVRRHIWRQQGLLTSRRYPHRQKLRQALREAIAHTLCHAA
jgi:hypothetical protein